MSKRRKFFSTFLSLAVLLLLFGVARAALNEIAGNEVAKIFVEGTGCAVKLARPRISFLPLQGQIEDVQMQCQDALAGDELSIQHILVDLDASALLQKVVHLRTVALFGVSTRALSENGALLKLIDFIVRDPVKPHEWKVVVDNVSLSGKGRNDALELQRNDSTFTARGVNLLFQRMPETENNFSVFANLNRNTLSKGQGRTIAFDELRLLGGFENGSLVMDEVQIVPQEVAQASGLRAYGTVSFETKTVDADLQWRIEPQQLGELLKELGLDDELGEKVQLLSGNASLRGPLDSPRILGEFNLTPTASLSEPSVPARCVVSDASAKFESAEKVMQLSELRIGHLVDAGAGKVEFGDDGVSGSVQLSVPQFTQAMADCFRDEEKESRPVTTGKNDFQKATLALTFRIPEKASEEGTVKADVTFSASEAKVESALLIQAKLSAEAIDGSLVERVNSPAQELRVEGGVATAARTQGELHGEFHVDRKSHGYSLHDIEAKNYPIEVLGAHLRSAGRDWSVSENDRGVKLSGSAEFQGQAGELHSAEAHGNIRDGSLLNIALDDARFDTQWTQGKGFTLQVQIQTPGGAVHLDATSDPNRLLQGTLRAADLNLQHFWQGSMPAVFLGAGAADLTLSGTISQPKLDGEILIHPAAETLGTAVPPTALEIHSKGDHIDFHLDALSGRAQADATLTGSGERTFHFNATAKDLPLKSFVPGAARQISSDHSTDWLVSADLSYDGALEDPWAGKGALTITKFESGESADVFQLVHPAKVTLSQRRIEFTDVVLSGENNQQFFLRGGISEQKGWDALISGSLALEGLGIHSEEIEQVSGNLSTSLQIHGPFLQPRTTGEIQLRSGSLSFPFGPTVIGADNMEFDARVDGDTMTVTRFEGHVGDGTVHGNGKILSVFSSPEITLNVVGHKLEIVPSDKLSFIASPNLTLQYSGAGPWRLSGRTEVEQLAYEDQVSLGKMLRALAQQITSYGDTAIVTAAKKEKSDSQDIDFDIDLVGEDNLLVDTNVAKAELRAFLKLRGNSSQPLLDGEVRVLNGTFGLQSSQFEVASGTLRFRSQSGTLDPKVDLVGETTVVAPTQEEQRVRLAISGTVLQPKVRFSSDGGLSQREIISLLGISANVDDFRFARKEVSDKGLLELLNPASGDSLRDRFLGITGFSEVYLDTTISQTTGELTPQVVARKPLLKDIDVILRSELASDQSSRATINYRLSPKLDLFAGWKTTPVTGAVSSSSGSFFGGIHTKKTFRGLGLIPVETRGAWSKQ